MAWQDRLKEAAYTSPGGVRQTFFYEDLTKQIDKKTSQFLFPDKDGAFVQDQGVGSRRYPFRLFFWGDNYDLQAEEFEKLLTEKGVGKLEHPVFGLKNVVPFGTITRRDNLKTASNQAIFDTVFYETIIDITFPESIINTEQEILNDISDFQDIAAVEFSGVLSIISTAEDLAEQDILTDLKSSVTGALDAIAKVQEDINTLFQTISEAMNDTISDIVNQPLELAAQAIILLKTPARVATSIAARLEGYTNVIDGLLTSIGIPGNNNTPENDYFSNSLNATASLTAAVEATLFNEFTTKPEALETVDALLVLQANIETWQDANIKSLSIIDQGNSYAQVKKIVSKATARLIELSFSLKEERIITLSRPRTIIDLVAELYGDLTQLDFFIISNNFTGDEILELPEGKEIKYYV